MLSTSLSLHGQATDYDTNNDGTLNILVLGTNTAIHGGEVFSPNQISIELENILSADAAVTTTVNVVAENIYASKLVTIGLGGGGTEYTWGHYRHSLLQYYYWPEDQQTRWDNLSGQGATDWDFVVIGADPYFVANIPGYYALGVNKIASKVAQGSGIPLLLMMWPQNAATSASTAHFEEFTYRIVDQAKTPLAVIPAGLAWEALPSGKQDAASNHPTPNGAYVAAASIYAHILEQSASQSAYSYDDEIADIAWTTVNQAPNDTHYSGARTFVSPFLACNISDEVINYNQTGTSSERGIRDGLNWVFDQSTKTLQNGGTSPINFNYGRANTNFEANKRYKINPSLFDFSFGFPMQDHGNHGDISMRYGLDKRWSGTTNDTDVGTAHYMIINNELPYGRAIPIRTLYVQMLEAIPGQSAYRDSWHMHRDLDKSVAAFMFTMLTGTSVLGQEPADQSSAEWRTWKSHEIGYETAWIFMHMDGTPPPTSAFYPSICTTLKLA
ncbi:MAG: hypothetical protein AAF840_00105 [Bacteroidota bacterium]